MIARMLVVCMVIMMMLPLQATANGETIHFWVEANNTEQVTIGLIGVKPLPLNCEQISTRINILNGGDVRVDQTSTSRPGSVIILKASSSHNPVVNRKATDEKLLEFWRNCVAMVLFHIRDSNGHNPLLVQHIGIPQCKQDASFSRIILNEILPKVGEALKVENMIDVGLVRRREEAMK